MDTLSLAVEATLRDGGGTFDARTYEPVSPEYGYAVGLFDGTLEKVAADNPLELRRSIRRCAASSLERGGSYVGTWINESIVHVDPVAIYAQRLVAMSQARRYGQKAVYDFSTGEDITL